jgi:hypothetical protein
MLGTRRLAEGIDPKARSFRTSLAAGKSLAQKRDLGHPLNIGRDDSRSAG